MKHYPKLQILPRPSWPTRPGGSAAVGRTDLPAASKLSVANKKAALLKSAQANDPALAKELSSSDDAKGLQQAAEFLANEAPGSDIIGVINTRLAELARNPDVSYGLQTKKYSPESADPQGARDALSNAVRRAADRLRHHFNDTDTALPTQAAKRLEGVGRVRLGRDGASFGVAGSEGDEAAYFVAGTAQSTHAFVVAPEFAARVTELLRGQRTPQSRLDLLAHYALQHSSFDQFCRIGDQAACLPMLSALTQKA